MDIISNKQLPQVEYPERPKEERPCSKNNKRPHEEEDFQMENALMETRQANMAGITKKPDSEEKFETHNSPKV